MRGQTSPLNDSNFFTARDLWFSDQALATATYGHIKDWNVTGVTNMSQAFKDKSTFDENITGWDVSNVTNMADMFRGATSFNQPIGDWNVSSVTSMTCMFLGASTFNQPIAHWDTSKVTRMEYMFSQAVTFNQPIGNWDTSKVTRMHYMFNAASAFNQPIANWNVSSVTNMGSMFNGASSFNEPISDWNTSSVTDLNRMFTNATSFNQDLSSWEISNVTDMSDLFFDAHALSSGNKGLIHSSFSSNSNWNTDWSAHVPAPASPTNANFQTAVDLWCSDKAAAFATYGHIKDWNVTGVTNMEDAFKDKTAFDENISGWDVSNVTNMHGMFEGASSFNQPIGNWNTSAVTKMSVMFEGASTFNQPIGNWDTGKVNDMARMFQRASAFNRDIGDWNTSLVTLTWVMFKNAHSFNQDISNWNVSAVTGMHTMFQNTPALSDVNKGLIHGTFSKNPNWPYDWSAHHTRPAHVVPSAANLRMLWVQPGTFTMGSPVTEAGREASKEQEHNVTLTEGFYLGKFEVTQAQYEAVMTGNSDGLSPTPSQFGGNPNRPVEKVSWNDVQIFLARLNALEAANLPAGWTYVLPSEAQWEYACRAGTTTAYSWGDNINSTWANYDQSGFGQTRDIGQYAANQWGFFDMHGNIWEWTGDRYQAAYPTGNPVIDPTGSTSGSARVARGGSWYHDLTNLRSARRNHPSQGNRFSSLGFRLAFRPTSPPPPITDANFTTAINLWFSDEANATRTYGHIRDWNVSAVTDMSNAFKDRANFNEDISEWDVSNVTDMSFMFRNAKLFDQKLGDWNVSAVTHMREMFIGASDFNQTIENWDTSKVTSMYRMFQDANDFNQPIGDWNVSAVTNMGAMFQGATAFNQPIGDWNVSSVRYMWFQFFGANSFNQDISNWDTGKVLEMSGMFKNATYFNQPIGDWNVSSVTGMHSMFALASSFNQPLGNWDVSKVTSMNGMFYAASSFNQPIGNWNVSSVRNMGSVFFNASSFNQDLSTWNVAGITNLYQTFHGASSLSNANKGKIHSAFSTNPNWPYDWSAFVTTPPPNPTGDNNKTQTDQNATAPPPGDPVGTLYRPLAKTLPHEEQINGKIRLWGQILASGGSPVTETAFEVADNLVFRKSTLHSASLLAGSPNFYASLTLDPGKRYYYRAVATNAFGTTNGSPKRFTTAGSPNRWWSDSIPQGKDWRTSPWLGTFRRQPGIKWIYHAQLGWAYAQPDGSGGLWLWMKDHRWLWTQQGVFPYLWKHQSASWHYLLGSQNGQPVFYEWRDSAASKQP